MLCTCALIGCDVYDSGLLAPRGAGAGGVGGTGGLPPHDASMPLEDGGDEDGGMCTLREGGELCNLRDDDCDGHTDEDTQAGCEAVIVNGVAECVELLGDARCVLRRCNTGFSNCDGDPTNGCEPYCMCHPCPVDDAGAEADGGS